LFEIELFKIELFEIEQDRVNVAFQMIDRDQRLVERERQRFGIGDPDQQSARESRTLGYGDGIDRFVGTLRFRQSLAHHRNNRPQMLARSQLGHNSSIRLMSRDLRSHNVRNHLSARTHHRRSGFVARAFNAKNVGVGHVPILLENVSTNRMDTDEP